VAVETRLHLDREGWGRVGMTTVQKGRCRRFLVVVNRRKSGKGREGEE
jgi:hypothetical protein